MKRRALVVDDAVLMRRLISTVLESDDRIEVAAVAANGSIALQKLRQDRPDFVTLDVEMPEMDGLETLRAIRALHPDLPVIMLSSATQRGAAVTLDALAAGASDYVTKPQNAANLGAAMGTLTETLIPKALALCDRAERKTAPAAIASPASRTLSSSRSDFATSQPELLVIATSTGGPNALSDLFSGLSEPLGCPVAIVQHMPPEFTRLLAERIDRTRGTVRCVEATDGQVLENGRAYLAPGGRHLAIERQQGRYIARLLDTPPENSCRPAADVLFRSAASAVGPAILGIVLTGMGSDGAIGSEAIREVGGTILVQDEASAVVWGMPGAVVRRQAADRVLPLTEMAPEILRRCACRPSLQRH